MLKVSRLLELFYGDSVYIQGLVHLYICVGYMWYGWYMYEYAIHFFSHTNTVATVVVIQYFIIINVLYNFNNNNNNNKNNNNIS